MIARYWSVAITAIFALAVSACEAPKEQSGTSASGIQYSSVLLKSTVLPGAVVKQLETVTGVDSGGGMVTEIVADSDGLIYVDTFSSAAGIYYDYDYTTQSTTGGYAGFYSFQIYSGGATLGMLAPVRYTSEGDFPGGDYLMNLTNADRAAANVNIWLVKKNDPDFTTGSITVNLFVYTVSGETNPVVSSQDDAEIIRGYLNNIFAQAGISVGAVNLEFRDDPGAISQMSSMDGLSQFLIAASRGTEGRTDTGINCFLMPTLPEGLVGMDGAIPGPGFLHGTGASGLVTLAASYGFTAAGYTSHETDQIYLALTLAHEMGHYLGLYHPSESSGQEHDPLEDTPECGSDNDTDGDGIVSGPECRGKGTEYLMFWTDDNEYISAGTFQTLISPQQGQVINTHPSAL